MNCSQGKLLDSSNPSCFWAWSLPSPILLCSYYSGPLTSTECLALAIPCSNEFHGLIAWKKCFLSSVWICNFSVSWNVTLYSERGWAEISNLPSQSCNYASTDVPIPRYLNWHQLISCSYLSAFHARPSKITYCKISYTIVWFRVTAGQLPYAKVIDLNSLC